MTSTGLEKILADYKPEAVSAEAIVDGQIRTHSQDWYLENSLRVSNTADEVATLLLKVLASEQEVMGQSAIDPKGRINEAKLRAYVLSRIEIFLNPPEQEVQLDEAAERKIVWEATVELAHQQFNSVRIYISHPKYQRGRVLYIDDLEKVRTVLGREPIKGDVIKVTNLRRKDAIKTPGPKGPMTWRNQTVVDICENQSVLCTY